MSTQVNEVTLILARIDMPVWKQLAYGWGICFVFLAMAALFGRRRS